MKKMDQYQLVAIYLNKLYDLLNERFFNLELLPRPVLTIQNSVGSYGHFTLSEHTWHRENGLDSHEINLSSSGLNRSIEEICGTILHEMTHYYNFQHGIRDCSRGGYYHSARFRKAAEEHGLIVERSDKYGWAYTRPSDELIEFCLINELPEIELCRNDFRSVPLGPGSSHGALGASGTSKSTSRKYACPNCGISVRATKAVRIGCLDCGLEMVLSNPR